MIWRKSTRNKKRVDFLYDKIIVKRITYYALDGLYTPRCKKSGVQYGFGTAYLTRYIDNYSIFVSIEDKKMKIVDTNERENFTLEGSILGNDVEQVRKTIWFLQY